MKACFIRNTTNTPLD